MLEGTLLATAGAAVAVLAVWAVIGTPEPGDVAHHLFSEIDEAGVRDGANIVVEGYVFAPSFAWKGTSVLGSEAFDAAPFLDLLAEYDCQFGVSERAQGPPVTSS